MPAASVIIPAFNCAHYLPAAIESVLEQTFSDLEIIVVDDGSTDETEEAVRPYLDRIQYIRQENRGLPGARNTGIRASHGEFIALLDADDSWVPDKLAWQMPCFTDAEIGIVYSDFSVKYVDGRFLPSYLAERPLASEGWIIDHYIQSRFLFPSSMVLRRCAMEACGLFDEEMLAAEDIELFAKICLRWKVARTEGTHNITANSGKMADYTILAFEKLLRSESELPSPTKRILHAELSRQHWWRGYARFKSDRLALARQDLLRSVRYDRRNLGRCAPFLLATLLPAKMLRRLQGGPKRRTTAL